MPLLHERDHAMWQQERQQLHRTHTAVSEQQLKLAYTRGAAQLAHQVLLGGQHGPVRVRLLPDPGLNPSTTE